MLVKKSIVERWYQRNHPIYKSFAYLFQNPLWTKRVPNGFSVCPYFWLSLFSLLVFRPFVVLPLSYLVFPLFRLFGKQVAILDRLCAKAMTSVSITPGSAFLGINIIFGFLISMAGVVAGAILYYGVRLAMDAHTYLSGIPGGLFAWYSIVSLLTLTIGLTIYKNWTETECKVYNYIYVWFALFLISSVVFVPHIIAAAFTSLFGILSGVVVGLCLGAWCCITFLCKWVVNALVWSPYGDFPLALIFVGVIALLFVFDWMCQKYQNITIDEDTMEERCRNAWVSLLHQALLRADGKSESGWIIREIYGDFNTNSALKNFSYQIFRRAVEIHFESFLNEHKDIYPVVNGSAFRKICKTRGVYTTLRQINEYVEVTTEGRQITAPEYSEYDFNKIISRLVSKDFANEIDAYVSNLKKLESERQRRKKLYRDSWSYRNCLRVTTAIGQTANRIGRGIRWLFVECWTLLVYLWTLVKSRKQGVCPYFIFTNPDKKDETIHKN